MRLLSSVLESPRREGVVWLVKPALKLLPSVVAFAVGLLLAPTAGADHIDEGDCKGGPDFYVEQSGVREDDGFGRDGVRADITRPSPPSPLPKTAIVRSIYLFHQNGIDMVEFGWVWVGDLDFVPSSITTLNTPIAFAARKIGTQYMASEGASGNPGHGYVPAGLRTFRISRNVPGDEPNNFFFYRDGLYFGKYGNPNIGGGGQPTGGTETEGPCDYLASTFVELDRQLGVNGAWVDWQNAFRYGDQNTKWWYTDKSDNPPKWWVFHCLNANCPNV